MGKKLKKQFLSVALLAAAGGFLTACAARGPANDPFTRSLTWQRYVGGDDLSRACAPGQPARYRLVYNAIEDEQQRTYDINALPEGGAMLDARVIGRPALNDPRNPISVRDPLAPWRGQNALYRLSQAEFAKLQSALTAAGFEKPAPKGLFLRGDSFFWTASACRDGVFHFHAWGWPSPEFDRMAEPLLDAILPYDKTGVPAQRPYEVPLPPYSSYFNVTDPDAIPKAPQRFQVGENGLRYSQGTID